MTRYWVVLLEAERDDGALPLSLEELERLVDLLAEDSPSGLWSVDRYALQFVVPAPTAHAAVHPAVARWQANLARLGLPEWPLVRVEVKTLAELEAELRAAENGTELERGPSSEQALRAAYRATRELLSARCRADAAKIVASLAARLGATVVPGEAVDPTALPFDLSLGLSVPMRATADRISVERLQLEEVLPTVVLDALRILRLVEGNDSAATLPLPSEGSQPHAPAGP